MLLERPYDLSIVTSTYNRHAELDRLLPQIRDQVKGLLRFQHLVIADGHDPEVERLCAVHGATYGFCEKLGGWGCRAKDVGVQMAKAEYVCFFDDDNEYWPFAALTLYTATYGFDMGVVQCLERRRNGEIEAMPSHWQNSFVMGSIDTMNVCVRLSIARQYMWQDFEDLRHNDYEWFKRVELAGARINFVPVVIGRHT